MPLENKVFSIVAIICMLAIAWIIGGHLWDLTSIGTTNAAQWILRISLIITLLIGIAIIPFMISTGRDIHPLNGIYGIGWLFTAFVLTYLLTGFVWDFATFMFQTFSQAPTLLFIIQFTIIMLIFIFDFIAPALIMLGDTEIGNNAGTKV